MKTKKTQSKSSKLSVGQKLKESSQLYLLMLPSIIIFLIFTYYPMYGVIIAFKDFKPALGIMGSKWVGMKNFITFFKSYQFSVTIKNTIVISFMYGQKLGSMSVGIPSSTLQHFPQLTQAFMRQPQWMVQTSGIRLLILIFHHWFQQRQSCLSFEWEAL